MNEHEEERTVDDRVWRVIGPMLLAIAMLGGGGFMTYIQGQISTVQDTQATQQSEASLLKERLRGVEVKTDGIQSIVQRIESDARETRDDVKRVREILEGIRPRSEK